MGTSTAAIARGISVEDLGRILDVTRKLAAPFDLASMLGEVVQAAKQILDSDSGTLWLYEREANELVMRVATGIEPVRVPADSGIVGECARTRTTINVPDCYADPRFNRDIDKRSGYRTRCLLALPLVGHDDTLVGVLQILNKRDGVFDSDDEQVAAALAAQCAVALQRVQMTEALVASERLKQEIEVARQVQMSTLPAQMPTLAGYEMFGRFTPADETGGDTFDLVRIDADRVLVVVGDATGHGIGPALSVTQMQAMLRVTVRLGSGLGEACAHVNDQLSDDLPDERFITACIGVLDASRHVFEHYAPGQGPLLHLHGNDGSVDRLLPTGPPLGAFPMDASRPPRVVSLAPGDVFALVSDGIFEWANESGEEFGIERAEAVLREHRAKPVSAVADLLFDAAREFAGPDIAQPDDVTIVLLKRLPEGTVSVEVRASLARKVEELQKAVALVESFWHQHRLPADDRFAVDYTIEELFTNIVKYGRTGPTPVELRLRLEPGAVVVVLVDPDSEDFDPTLDRGVDTTARVEARTPGGLGLHTLQKMVENLEYRYTGRESRISFRKRLGNN